MRKAAVLFNGIRFPFAIIDRAFEWARKENAALLFVFLLSTDTEPEGYIFPSDIDAAENISDEADSLADNEHIVASNVQMLKHRATSEQIEVQTIELHDPSWQLLTDTLQGCDHLFVTGDINEVSTATIESVDLNEWLDDFAGTVEKIPHR